MDLAGSTNPLRASRPATPATVAGDSDDFCQVLMSLLLCQRTKQCLGHRPI